MTSKGDLSYDHRVVTHGPHPNQRQVPGIFHSSLSLSLYVCAVAAMGLGSHAMHIGQESILCRTRVLAAVTCLFLRV
jgi:hypothetical protein